jgi:hypothetical protein
VGFNGFTELGQHYGAADAAMGGDRERVAGVVIKPVEDLHMSAISEPPVGEVGLPALIGLLGGDPDIRRLGPLLRGGGDQPGRGQVAVDCRYRHNQAVVVLQVPGDGVRAVVESFARQLLLQPDDQIDCRLCQPRGAAVWPAGAGLERGLALGPIALDQPRDPTLRDPVFTGHLRLATTLDNDSGDHETSLRHQLTLGRSPHSDVLRHAIRMS